MRFADVGWVAFDPTPPDPDRRVGGGTSNPTLQWAERSLDDVTALLGGGLLFGTPASHRASLAEQLGL